MPDTQQNILVKIKVLLEGLSGVRDLGKHIKELAPAGAGARTTALAGDIDRLSTAVERLAASQEKAAGKGGFVRFLVGVSAVVNTLATVPQAFEGLGKLLDFFDAVGGGVGKASGKVKETLSSFFSSASEFASGVGARASSALSGLGGAAVGMGGALAGALPVVLAVGAALAVVIGALAAAAAGFIGLAVAVGLGSIALTKIASRGLAIQRELEGVRLGIAAVITSLAQVRVDGLPVEGAEKFRAAMAISADQLQKLRVDAVNTVATFGQIAPAFQAAIAPGLAARLTLDQIRGITVKVVQAASAIGLPLEQVNQEVRAILEGTINEDARLAKVLGISNEMVKSWKQQGTLAEELNRRLEGFALAGVEASQTMDGLTSNLQEALDVFSGEATGRAFSALKAEFARLLPQLFDFRNAGIQAQFKTLAQLADAVLVRVVRIGGAVAQGIVAWLKKSADFVSQNRATIDDILNLVEMVVRQLMQAGGVIVRVGSDTATWKSLLETVKGVLGLINVLLAVMVSELRKAEPLLRLAALAGAALLAANPTLAALSRAATGGGANQEEPTGFSSVRLNPDGSLKSSIGVEGLPKPPGSPKGGGGGGGRQSQVRELRQAFEEAKIEAALAQVQAKSELIRQNIEATVDALRTGLEDSIISISEAFRLEALKADEALQNELGRIDAEVEAAARRHKLALESLDPKLTAEEKRLAVLAENTKLLTETNRLEAERKKLVEETADKKAALVRDEALANEELRRSIEDIESQVVSLSGSAAERADAAASEIESRFKETRERLEAEVRAGSKTAEDALGRLGKLVGALADRAKFDGLARVADSKLDELRDLEALLDIGVSQGAIKSRDALKRRLELEREYKRALLETINGLAEIARRTDDPELAAKVRQLQIEWAQLGHVIDETAKRIDDTLRGGLEDTLVSIITRTESVGEAFRKLAQTILAEIARIVAANLVEKLFGGLLNTGGGGSIGNILAQILGGGAPKTSGAGAPAGSGVENIPLIIKNFQGGALFGLRDVSQKTKGVADITSQGFGQVTGLFGQTIPLLGTIANASKAQAGAMVAATALSIFKQTGILKADGGPISGPGTGTSDSIWARVSNGEFVIREWAARMLGPDTLGYINRFGRLPFGVLPEAPRFALGGAVGELASTVSGARPLVVEEHYHATVNAPIQTQNAESFRGSEQQVKRELARATQAGFRRAQSQKKN